MADPDGSRKGHSLQDLSWQDLSWKSSDGLELYARDYPARNPRSNGGHTIVCMHGLTRNSADFANLAHGLSHHHRVLVPEQRGRGRSQYDSNPHNYQLPTYVRDTLDLLSSIGCTRSVLVGTSMGGLMAMAIGSTQPAAVAGIVLNDIGPVVESQGLDRIRGYVGKSQRVVSWPEAVAECKRLNTHAFPDFDADQWQAFTRALYRENDQGLPELAYDPAIATPLNNSAGAAVPDDLWPVFEGLTDIPTLVIRGALSDILSRDCVAEMARRHPRLTSVEVADRGHAPTLDETVCVDAINAFLAALPASDDLA